MALMTMSMLIVIIEVLSQKCKIVAGVIEIRINLVGISLVSQLYCWSVMS